MACARIGGVERAAARQGAATRRAAAAPRRAASRALFGRKPPPPPPVEEKPKGLAALFGKKSPPPPPPPPEKKGWSLGGNASSSSSSSSGAGSGKAGKKQMVEADWLGVGGFTLDSFLQGGKKAKEDEVKFGGVKKAGKGQEEVRVEYKNRDGDRFILINPSDAQLNKKDRFGFTVNEYLALGTTGGNRKGQRMNEAQSAALKKRIQGTARDYFKTIIQVEGRYVEGGWTDAKEDGIVTTNTSTSAVFAAGAALAGVAATLVAVLGQTPQ